MIQVFQWRKQLKNLEFDPLAFEDLTWWVKNDRKKALKILKLVKEIQRDPFEGIGSPEKLKHDLSGLWSRRIDNEHRLVYQVKNDKIRILACRYHYE